MKLNKFFALAVIALLVVGAMGLAGAKSFAQTSAPPAAQTQDCTHQDDDSAQVKNGTDADTIDLQCGDQSGPDVQEGDQNAPDSGLAEANETAETNDGKETTPTGTPAISAEQAQTAAQAAYPGSVVKVDLDDEDGKLIYSVEMQDGVDVKVDAMTGVVINVENSQGQVISQ